MILARLHRLDKHHAITPAIAAPETFQIEFVYDDWVQLTSAKSEISGEVHDGTQIARVRLPHNPGVREVDVKPRIEFTIMLGNATWADATTPLLTWTRDEVLARFESILRKLA